jgi:hypothetical protein
MVTLSLISKQASQNLSTNPIHIYPESNRNADLQDMTML